MVKPVVQQGRSERWPEAYSVRYVEGQSDARTMLATGFTILLHLPDERHHDRPLRAGHHACHADWLVGRWQSTGRADGRWAALHADPPIGRLLSESHRCGLAGCGVDLPRWGTDRAVEGRLALDLRRHPQFSLRRQHPGPHPADRSHRQYDHEHVEWRQHYGDHRAGRASTDARL